MNTNARRFGNVGSIFINLYVIEIYNLHHFDTFFKDQVKPFKLFKMPNLSKMSKRDESTTIERWSEES